MTDQKNKESTDKPDNLTVYKADESDWEDFWYNEDARDQTATLYYRRKSSGDD